MIAARHSSRQNLQGRSFKGQDLTGADFSHSDIRGADFTDANLKGANFSYAIAGLPARAEWRLLIIALLLSAIPGIAAVINAYTPVRVLIPNPSKPITYVAAVILFFAILLVNALLWALIIRQGIQKALEFISASVAVAVPILGIFAALGNDNNKFFDWFRAFRTANVEQAMSGGGNPDEPAYVVVALAGLVTATIAAVIALGLAVFLAAVVAGDRGIYLVVAEALAVGTIATGIVTRNGARYFRPAVMPQILAVTFAVILAGAVVLLSAYVAKKVLAEHEQYTAIRQIAIAIAALGGTGFRGANLTDAHFSYATLKSADFRNANVTRTRWYRTEKLGWARVGDTILSNPAVRDLLVSGKGSQKSYAGANLRGANLIRADLSYVNLKEADISEATFRDACLEWANLTQAQAIGTDFTNAQLTGACGLGTWNIDSTTQLEWVDCRFVYLLEDCKPGTDDRERRPSSGTFKPEEFTKLFQQVLNTVDLIFRNGIDWQAFTYSYQKVQVENEDTELTIQSIENKGDGVVVVRVSVPPGTDKAKIHSEFTETYEEALKALEAQYQAELRGKEEQLATYRLRNANMMEVVRLLASRPASVYQAKALTERKSISGKLVILNLGQGDFNTGFPVTLQIGAEGERPSTQKQGYLPPAPDIVQHYIHWQSTYCDLDKFWRIKVSSNQVTNLSPIKTCQKYANIVSDSLNSWLNSEEFRPIKDVLLRKLDPSEEIRLILQTENNLAHRLPWQLWDFFENYSKTEIALSAPEYDRAEKSPPDIPRTKVRILAILGNSANIDIEKDRQLIKQLPDADPTFLPEPTRRQVDVQLWDEAGWDILFFAGHSHSQEDTGCIYINPTDSLTVAELKYALRAAVERGLKLAIFNSCDGLGLARDLADLRIPQIIVMREPVPDAVAEAFLQHFVKAFAGGKSLYASVREAREKLHAFEDEFPCASWLPVICQHPAEVPLTWEELRGVPAVEPSVKELLQFLAQLQEALEADTDLNPRDKADALEDVRVLVRAANNPPDESLQNLARKALKSLKATMVELPVAAPLAQVSQQILPAISEMLNRQ